MDTVNMIINVIAIMAGLTIYIAISNTKWGKAHQQFQYAIMLGAILLAVFIGGFIRWLIILK
ncbi:hypothetical protein SAMN04487830_12417 [Pseudobutyrivibrio sp. OR37]|uniref:hypothetical protein n=1 Tax=Pseudobutyrivibrio sp. OR37 TaxID=1798186 RepID=UPI0008F2424B|nr:hypothetical protein [Pseudobutyrivibrio sp. OR37]SFI12913.1 hypothetical protein SAMN04487830_12417 [Pseudobutyrivibrio sp. OR37]